MFVKIPFESEIEFKTNISEITKMSLEHEFNTNDGVVLGNFYITGEYKSHPISVNTEPFKYTLPFTVEIRDDIKLDTLEFNIEDFTYDILDDNKLKINIEYSVKADLKDNNILDSFERVNENELNNEMKFIDSFLDNEKKEVINNEESKENDREDKENNYCEEEIDRNIDDEQKTIMNTIKDSDDTFVTYHIHVVNTDETIESICKKYNVSQNIVNEYNNIENVIPGEKILIPEIDE